MCQAKPGPRCKADTVKLVDVRRKQFHAASSDIATTDGLKRRELASLNLWLARLEAAGADPGFANDAHDGAWMHNAGLALGQARAEQAALMPVKPGSEAPERVRAAYDHLAKVRDDLARADAIATADVLTPGAGSAPGHGARPDYRYIDERVAAAEYDYVAANNGPDETSGWRHLMTHGQMPYDPFSFADHPAASMSAPWVQHHRPTTAADVHTLRRVTGFNEHVTWDCQRGAAVIAVDPDGYLDDDEREHTLTGLRQSLWQLGFHTEDADGARVVIARSPDLPKWRKTTARPAGKKVAA